MTANDRSKQGKITPRRDDVRRGRRDSNRAEQAEWRHVHNLPYHGFRPSATAKDGRR